MPHVPCTWPEHHAHICGIQLAVFAVDLAFRDLRNVTGLPVHVDTSITPTDLEVRLGGIRHKQCVGHHGSIDTCLRQPSGRH